MKSLSQYLITENFKTAIGKDKIQLLVDEYGDELIKMIGDSYRYIGGAIGFETKEDIVKESDLIKLYKNNGEITAVVCYATKRHPNSDAVVLSDDRSLNFGRKICCFASKEGHSEDLAKILKEDFKDARRNVWCEASAKPVTFLMKLGAKPIPNNITKKILKDKILTDLKDDGFFYTREIGGKPHTKVILGNHLFYDHVSDQELTKEELDKFKKLAIKYSSEEN